jgi:hypothetical protein
MTPTAAEDEAAVVMAAMHLLALCSRYPQAVGTKVLTSQGFWCLRLQLLLQLAAVVKAVGRQRLV